MKKLFVIAAGITFGAVIGAFAMVKFWSWWDNRPVPRDTMAIRAQYEKPFTEAGTDGSPLIEMRYILRNTTDRDIKLLPSDTTLFIQRNDGALIDLKDIVTPKIDSATVPAGDSLVYFVHPLLPYKADKDCSVTPAKDPNSDQLSKFLTTCYKWLKGFVLIDDQANLQVNLPFVEAKKN